MDAAATELYPLSLHDALPILTRGSVAGSTSSVVVVTPIENVRSGRRTVASTRMARTPRRAVAVIAAQNSGAIRSEEHTPELQSHVNLVCRLLLEKKNKSTTIA